jgi:hypothetical protein
MTGPVQVLVIGIDEPTFSGEVMAELDRLREAGTVRVLDLLLVERGEDGAFDTVPLAGSGPPGLGDLAAQLLGTTDDTSEPSGESGNDEPAEGAWWSLADAIPAGTMAAVVLLEHVWAGPLRDAVQRAGGTALDETWLTRDDVQELERLIAERDA